MCVSGLRVPLTRAVRCSVKRTRCSGGDDPGVGGGVCDGRMVLGVSHGHYDQGKIRGRILNCFSVEKKCTS